MHNTKQQVPSPTPPKTINQIGKSGFPGQLFISVMPIKTVKIKGPEIISVNIIPIV
jgi:hypothetical protein